MTEWRHVPTIGRVELRRRWRSLQDNTGQLIAIAFAGLFGLLFVGIVFFGVFAIGLSIRSGDLDSPIGTVRTGLIYIWIFIAAFGGYRAYATALRPDRLDGLLTTVSHREVLGGLLFAEAVLWGVPGAVFVGLCAIVFAVGTSSILAAPFAFITIGLVMATALTSGFVIALLVRNTGVRSKLLTRLRTVLVAVLGLAYFGLIITQAFETVLAPVYWLLAPTPIGWFADLLLLGTVETASLVRAGGVVVASGAFFVISAPVLSRLAAWLWYADGVSIEHDTSTTTSSGEETRLDRLVSRPLAGVIIRDWKRARRAPITLSFVIYPVFVLIGPVTTTVQTGQVGSSFPILVILSGAWATGALFSLNVLGNEGAVLPATLLAHNPGRTLVVGHSIAAALLGVPLTVVSTVGLGVLSSQSLGAVGTLSVSAMILTLCAGPIASGIGAVFPRFEEVSVSRSSKAIVPSMVGFVVYSIVLLIVALPTLAGHSAIIGHAIASWLNTSQISISIIGTAITILFALGTGVLSARYAIQSVTEYRFD